MFAQLIFKGGNPLCRHPFDPRSKKPDHRLSLLRPQWERPHCRATEKRYELAPPHVYPSGRRLIPTTPPVRLCITANSGGYVRFGSKADIGEGATDVRFTPKSGLMHCSKKILTRSL